jgi:hypothetical protein
MANQVVVHKGRTVILPVAIGYDVSGDEIRSQIREETDKDSPLIAEWTVSFLTDGTDGEVLLTLDNSVTGLITKTLGYMDMVRIVNGEPLPVFDDILEVLFKDTITV